MRLAAAFITFFVLSGSIAHAQDDASVAASELIPEPGNPYSTFSITNSDNEQTLDYQAVTDFLGALTRKNRSRTDIYYSAMGGAGQQYLDRLVAFLGSVDPRSLSRNEQLAYWLNLHNLLVLQAFAGENPRNIDDERGDAIMPGSVWAAQTIKVAGLKVSIHDIEVKILGAYWDNPDIIYGLYQGARGGAPLSQTAFSGPIINTQLRELGEEYLDSRRTLRVRNDKVSAPAIFAWYKEPFFDNNDQAVLAHLAARTPDDDDKKDISAATSIEYEKFDYRSDAEEPRRINNNLPGIGVGGPQSPPPGVGS